MLIVGSQDGGLVVNQGKTKYAKVKKGILLKSRHKGVEFREQHFEMAEPVKYQG